MQNKHISVMQRFDHTGEVTLIDDQCLGLEFSYAGFLVRVRRIPKQDDRWIRTEKYDGFPEHWEATVSDYSRAASGNCWREFHFALKRGRKEKQVVQLACSLLESPESIQMVNGYYGQIFWIDE